MQKFYILIHTNGLALSVATQLWELEQPTVYEGLYDYHLNQRNVTTLEVLLSTDFSKSLLIGFNNNKRSRLKIEPSVTKRRA
jgi:hypothetical protein